MGRQPWKRFELMVHQEIVCNTVFRGRGGSSFLGRGRASTASGDTRPARFALRPADVPVGGALRGETKAVRPWNEKAGLMGPAFIFDYDRGYWAALMLIVSFWAMGSPPWMKVSAWSPVGALDGTSTLN